MGDPARRLCYQIHFIWREFRRRFGLSVEGNLALHQPRPIPDLPTHGQPAGLAEG
jgi:hypothetical protein